MKRSPVERVLDLLFVLAWVGLITTGAQMTARLVQRTWDGSRLVEDGALCSPWLCVAVGTIWAALALLMSWDFFFRSDRDYVIPLRLTNMLALALAPVAIPTNYYLRVLKPRLRAPGRPAPMLALLGSKREAMRTKLRFAMRVGWIVLLTFTLAGFLVASRPDLKSSTAAIALTQCAMTVVILSMLIVTFAAVVTAAIEGVGT
jgi:hypothetical protein